MTILGIDTSCDETSVSLLKDGQLLHQEVFSQIDEQKVWGGVVPMLAKRKHIERIEYVIIKTLLASANDLHLDLHLNSELSQQLKEAMERRLVAMKAAEEQVKVQRSASGSYQEPVRVHGQKLELTELPALQNPGIDLIAVTVGPGLAVALEVGIDAAIQLANSWQTLITPINHMEGHFWSGFIGRQTTPANIPAGILGILISGNHTELVFSKRFGEYEILGETLDDAAGEAFDKFATMLGLPYPGGPEVESLAELAQDDAIGRWPLPIPMKNSGDLNFSFSGLKTAALYSIGNRPLTAVQKAEIAFSFQHSVTQSLSSKVQQAIKKMKPAVLVAGGGVVANQSIALAIRSIADDHGIEFILPEKRFLGDNASMIAYVGYLNHISGRNIYTAGEVEFDRRPSLKIDEQ